MTNPAASSIEQSAFEVLHNNFGGDINRVRLRDAAQKIANALVVEQKPAATVIKNGAERQFMSENLGGVPDGTYSLYLAPIVQAAQKDLSATALIKLWQQAEELATPTMPAPFQFAQRLLNPQ